MSDERVLLPYQSAWIAAAGAASLAVIEKSRRVGITWADAADDVLCAAEEGGQNVYYISYNLDQSREYVETCAEWAKHYAYACSEVQEEIVQDEDDSYLTYRITFASGKRIVGLPNRATTLRGKQGRIVIDEAAFIPDLPEVLKAALAMLMWGGSVRVISTHNGVASEFNELLGEIRAGGRRGVVQKVTIQDALDQGLYRRICEVTGKEWSPEAQQDWLQDLIETYGESAQEELFCVPREGGALYFPRALVERAMKSKAPVVRYEQTDDFTYRSEKKRTKATSKWIKQHLEPVLAIARVVAVGGERRRCYLGMDIARSGDLSVISAAVETARLDIETVVQIEMRNMPFSEQQRILHYTIDGLPNFSGAAIDARGNGQMLAEQAAQKYGPAYVHEVMLTRATYAEYFPRYKQRLEDETYVLPKDSGLMDDHRVVQLDKGVPIVAEKTGPADQQRHGDSAVSNMLVCYAQANDDGTYQPYAHHAVKIAAAGVGRWLGRSEDDDGEEDEDW
ncbi:MAG: hypothetical protein OXC31_07840 [Spirochaetaceae bacterium]|nr:hypothetical protein [Spirochaetaceae bacterium]